MRKNLLFCIVVFFAFHANGQALYDTLTSESILKGNTIMYGSSKIGDCRVQGYYFTKFYSGSCDQFSVITEKYQFKNIENTDSTLNIKLSIEGNCCFNFLSEIELVEDSILNVIYHSYGAIGCDCDCSFCLEYTIQYYPKQIKQIADRPSQNIFVRYLMINGDRNTLKVVHLNHLNN